MITFDEVVARVETPPPQPRDTPAAAAPSDPAADEQRRVLSLIARHARNERRVRAT